MYKSTYLNTIRKSIVVNNIPQNNSFCIKDTECSECAYLGEFQQPQNIQTRLPATNTSNRDKHRHSHRTYMFSHSRVSLASRAQRCAMWQYAQESCARRRPSRRYVGPWASAPWKAVAVSCAKINLQNGTIAQKTD